MRLTNQKRWPQFAQGVSPADSIGSMATGLPQEGQHSGESLGVWEESSIAGPNVEMWLEDCLLYRGRFEMSGAKHVFQFDYNAASGHRKMPSAYD
jgi:hypothetical protein